MRRALPAARQRALPAARQRALPPARQRALPPARQRALPPARQRALPAARQRALPPARQRALPPARQRALPAAVGALALTALVALLSGWSLSVVISGSMRPAVEAGDVVITAPLTGQRIRAGSVIRFRSPDRPGRAVLHRVARVAPDGRLITKGDANAVADATPVPAGAVTGVGRLRIRYAGLPVLWWRRGGGPRLAALAGVPAALIVLVGAGWRPGRPATRSRVR
ncbi:signal peptidase I [Actinoplanes teichomyceticus]|uniref:signal peptidase I n=1 Tax=Actinoplanes teichomyceticus TaxID=1867 RepID=UPI0013DD9BA2|nr:signal peptidase I [Actinoplanes teichomyceticus]